MIVVAIIAVLAAIAVPNFMRARKRSQATKILNELRILKDAQDQYYLENPSNAAAVGWPGVKQYIKAGTRLYSAFSGSGPFAVVKDPFGNNYKGYVSSDGDPGVGILNATFNQLSDVAPLDFWSPYGVY